MIKFLRRSVNRKLRLDSMTLGNDDKKMSHPHPHSTHPAIVKRLNRATGHLRSIVDMIENGRSCSDIAMQLQAVEKAIATAKRTLIQITSATASVAIRRTAKRRWLSFKLSLNISNRRSRERTATEPCPHCFQVKHSAAFCWACSPLLCNFPLVRLLHATPLVQRSLRRQNAMPN